MKTARAASSAPVSTQILLCAMPSTLAMTAVSACTLLDALLLSRSGAAQAAAAVGYPVITLIQTIGFTLGTGAGAIVSRSLGSGNRENALRAASAAFFLALLISGAVCIPGFLCADALSRLLGADAQSLSGASLYIRYILSSAPPLCMNLVLSSILRAETDTTAYMTAYLVGSGVGCALQFLLISVFNLGLAGSGIAMLARESAISFVLLFLILRHGGRLRPRPGLFVPSRPVLAELLRYGAPTLVRQGATCASAMLLSRVSSGFGQAALAGMGVSARLLALVASSVIGFGQGFQPVCGYAIGAGDMARVREAYRFSMRFVVIALLFLAFPFYFFAGYIVRPLCASPEIAAIAAASLRAQSVILFAQGAIILMNMLTQALGMAVRASAVAASRQGYVLILLLLVLPRAFGLPGLILCQSASDALSLILCILFTRHVLPADRPPHFRVDTPRSRHYNRS